MGKETPDLSGLLGNLLSNPGALSALSGILGNLGGTAGKDTAVPAMLPPSGRSGRYHDREGLLGALRPYLSPKRCQALEGACKLLEVIELFRTQ